VQNYRVIIATRPLSNEFFNKLMQLNLSIVSLSPIPIPELLQYTPEDLRKEVERKIESLCETPSKVHDLLQCPKLFDLFITVLIKYPNDNLDLLLTRIIDLNNEHHLVKKHKMESGANFTEVSKASMAVRNFDFYCHIAIANGAVGFDDIPKTKTKLAKGKTPPPVLQAELLSYGLLTESNGALQFKHKAFAEYFANLIKTRTGVSENGNEFANSH